MSKYSLRPYKSGQSDLKDIYKIFAPRQLYSQLRPNAKDLWILEDDKGSVAFGKLSQAQDEIQNKVFQVTHEFKDLFGLSFSDNYSLKRSNTQARHATDLVLVEEISEDIPPLNTSDLRRFWEGLLYAALVDKLVSPGLRIEHVQAPGETRSFSIKAISNAEAPNDLRSPVDLHMVSKACNLRIEISAAKSNISGFQTDRRVVFGLDQQLDTIDKVLEFYGSVSHPFGRINGTGILLIGPHGTGTDEIAEHVSKLPWAKTTTIMDFESRKSLAKSLSQIFTDSSKNQPSLIRIPHLQQLLTDLGDSQEYTLVDAFKIIADAKVLVVAEVKDTKISRQLSNCFRFQIEMPSLTSDTRYNLILNELNLNTAEIQSTAEGDFIAEGNSTAEVVTIVAQKTRGYIRADVARLVKQAIYYAHIRLIESFRSAGKVFLDPEILYMVLEDFEKARLDISPTTEDPIPQYRPVKWSDIGGQEETKKTVEMLFEWPLKYPEKFKTLGLRPAKGLLLYGPPGCSKTMTALALATESNLNFIAVKGPELLNKFVGESEANIRNLFAKAKRMAPCVLFFDELDSIGSGNNSTSESKNGINLVSTLLNELDGVDELVGVSVLAATNKPWDLDKALIRAGRFDKLIYVKLPDESSRRDIIRIRLEAMENDVVQHQTIDLNMLAEITEGCSGAEIVDMCRDAAMEALKESIYSGQTTKFTGKHFDKALLGLRRDTSPDMLSNFATFEHGYVKS